jgi:hypothetical protein
MPSKQIKVNRAPVMTLWAAVVAERLGHDHEAALTLGKAVAGLNAQAKGRRLGIYEEPPEQTEAPAPSMRPTGDQVLVSLLGRPVPAVQTSQGVRATVKGQAIDAGSVRRYLACAFGNELAAVQVALEELARALCARPAGSPSLRLVRAVSASRAGREKGLGCQG